MNDTKIQAINVLGLHCEHCAHEWVPRRAREPRECPNCHSRTWRSGGVDGRSLRYAPPSVERKPSRATIYVHAECICGAVYQSAIPLHGDVDLWMRLWHEGQGHAASRLLEPRRAFEWRDGGMRPC